MALKLFDRVSFVVGSTGTGDVTIPASARTGFRLPAAAGMGAADSTPYVIAHAASGAEEVGTCVLNGGGTALVRTPTQSTATANGPITLDGSETLSFTVRAADLLALAVRRGHIAGLKLSTAGASSTFGVSDGEATDSTNAVKLTLPSAFTKTTSAWAAGTGNGGLDTGTIAANTSYHAYLIQRPDTGVVEPIISLSASAPTLPANYTLYRRIGGLRTDASSQWIKFVQAGDRFLWDVGFADYNASGVGTTALLINLTVPTGVRVTALGVGGIGGGPSGTTTLITSPDVADTSPTATGLGLITSGTSQVSVPSELYTNTSGQIRIRSTTNAIYFQWVTLGWIDRRGQDD